MDIAGSLIALIVLAPLLLLIALLIRMTDPGPVMFRQERVGRDGKLFVFFKFRSMPVSTPNVQSSELSEVRLRPVGRLIRRTNLDELPQLYNVLRGDMSLIGPRPAIPAQANLIRLRSENGSLALRPGLTGWAQVNAFDGMSEEQKSDYDCVYARRIGFWLDMYIVLRTVVYLLKPPPKY